MTSKSRPSFIPLAVLLVAAAALTCSGAANADISPIQPAAAATAVAGEHSREPLVLWSGPTGQFVTCVARDRTGWWWGTEGDGLWHYAPNGQPGRNWAHVRACDGAGDDAITALAVDRQDRLWVGTARQGVTVYNGAAWKNYDQLTGPIGAHVTGIAVSPLSGDVWMTTDAGLSIYVQATKTWRYITRADGLVSDQLTCIAFTSAGKVIVGTAADGVEMASPKDDYAAWQRNTTPDDGFMRQPNAGELPLSFDLINCVLVSKLQPERIYAGTTSGLMWSADDGATWSFQRGQDHPAKVAGRIDKTQIIPFAGGSKPLTEDYVTCLAEDDSGQRLYVGHWRLGYEVIDEATGERVYRSVYLVLGDFIKAIIPGGPNTMLLATYGRGISLLQPAGPQTYPGGPTSKSPSGNSPEARATTSQREGNGRVHSPLPEPATPPTDNNIAAMAARLDAAAVADERNVSGYYLGENWQTEGDWVGRFGRQYAKLCAVESPFNDVIVTPPFGYDSKVSLGYSADTNEGLRAWIQWLQTDDARVLYDPIRGVRREAEDDDHGETYPATQQGPDVWVSVTVPAGMHRLSLYFMNKDGHDGLNQRRDFIVQLKKATGAKSIALACQHNSQTYPTIATARVKDFWFGVYEEFAVSGPGQYYVKIDRNYSLDTILQSVMLDRLAGPKGTDTHKLAWLAGLDYSAPAPGLKDKLPQPSVDLWAKLDGMLGNPYAANLQLPYRVLLMRAASAPGGNPALAAAWRWKLGVWTRADGTQYAQTMARAWSTLQAQVSKAASSTKK